MIMNQTVINGLKKPTKNGATCEQVVELFRSSHNIADFPYFRQYFVFVNYFGTFVFQNYSKEKALRKH